MPEGMNKWKNNKYVKSIDFEENIHNITCEKESATQTFWVFFIAEIKSKAQRLLKYECVFECGYIKCSLNGIFDIKIHLKKICI